MRELDLQDTIIKHLEDKYNKLRETYEQEQAKLAVAVEALDEIGIGGRPYRLGELEFDDPYNCARAALARIKEQHDI